MRFFPSRRREPPPEALSGRILNALLRKHVLIVDDDEMLCALIKKYGEEKFWCEVDVVHTVSAAQTMIFESDIHFDLLILDVRMTNGEGVKLYRTIIENDIQTPVIFLTGYDNLEFRKSVEEIGPARVHSKPAVLKLEFLDRLLFSVGLHRKTLVAC